MDCFNCRWRPELLIRQGQAEAALKIVEIEDFPVAEGIQCSMEQGQISEVVYGKNEPNLALFYQRMNQDLGREES